MFAGMRPYKCSLPPLTPPYKRGELGNNLPACRPVGKGKAEKIDGT